MSASSLPRPNLLIDKFHKNRNVAIAIFALAGTLQLIDFISIIFSSEEQRKKAVQVELGGDQSLGPDSKSIGYTIGKAIVGIITLLALALAISIVCKDPFHITH